MLDTQSLRRHWSTLAALAVAVAALGIMGWRILHGVDLLDEAFYAAIPARFAMGDRPFVEDLSVAQTAGLLLYPFVKAYFAIAGSTGVFLFLRVLYLVFFACVGWSAYAMARPHVPRPTALLLATACCCYLPYSLPGLGYNTLAIGLFAIGLFTSVRWLLDEQAPARRPWREPIYWAGLAHAAACFAYPTQVLSAFAALACLVVLARGRRLRALVLYVAGGLTFTALLSPVLFSAGLAGLRDMVHYTSGDSPGSGFAPAVVVGRLADFLRLHPELPLAAAALLAAAVAVRYLPRAVALAMIFFPLAVRGSVLVDYLGSIGFVAGFGALAPLLALALGLGFGRTGAARRTAVVLAVGVAVPSMVAGLMWSLSSTNREMAAGIGLLPAAIAAALCLALFVQHALASAAERPDASGASAAWTARLAAAASLSPAVLVILLLGYVLGDAAYYNDGPRHRLTERMTEGPYWGLSTTPANAAKIRALSADLRAYRGGPGSHLYYNVPAAYLIAERPPLVGAVWIFPAPMRLGRDAASLLARAEPGDLILRDPQEPALIAQIIAATCDLLVRRDSYDVLVYRGFGKTNKPPLAPLPFDQWRGLGKGQGGDELAVMGWSWAEEWGRWSLSSRADLLLPRPETPAGGTTVQLDVLPHVTRAVRRQRYRILVDHTVVAEGAIGGDGGVIELTVPAALEPQPVLHLILELPDAQPLDDGRLLGLGLRRVRISRAGGPTQMPATTTTTPTPAPAPTPEQVPAPTPASPPAAP